MAYEATFRWSNTTDQIFDVAATDADTGVDIDFSAATAISFVVGDSFSCPVVSATLAGGQITIPTSNIIEVNIPASMLQAACPQTYKVGMTYELNGEINQLIYGTVSIYDGIARL